MIRNCGGRIIAHLADDSVCKWELNGAPLSEAVPTIICDSALIAVACRLTGVYAMLTHNGRVFVGIRSSNCLEDITDLIPLAARRELIGCDTEILLNARTRYSFCTVAIKTQTSISIVDIGFQTAGKAKRTLVKYLGTEIYPSGINMFGFDAWHAVIRTNSNSLHLINTGYEQSTSRPICRPEIESIQQIVCADSYIFILKQDRVVGERSVNGILTEQVDVFNEEPVSKITTDGPHIFIITVEGLCYYLNYRIHKYGHPSLIRALKGYHVENLFVLEKLVIFQYDGGRLCFLCLSDGCGSFTKRIDLQHMVSSTPPYLLPSCENMGIIAVESMGKYIAFITDEGRVYSALALNLESQPLVEIPFFTANPLMIRGRVIVIKSAGSDPRDA